MDIKSNATAGLTRRGFVGASAVALLAAAGFISLKGGAQEALADGTATRTVTDARGEVEIPADPQRIVDLSGNSDMLKILGFDVVGTANSDAYDYTKFPAYLEDQLAGATILGYSYQDTMDIEAILALDPDLIIISAVQEKMYDQLQSVCPTVMIELAQIDWKEDVKTFAEVLDRTEQADAWLAAYEEKAAAMGERIRSERGEDTTYLSFLASGGQLYVFDAAGFGMVMYEDMGLAKPAGMPEQENVSLPVVDYEGLAAIDADFIFAIGTDDDLKALNDSKLYQAMRAVQAGDVVELPASPYFNEGYGCIGKDTLVSEFPYLLEGMDPDEARAKAREDMAAESGDGAEGDGADDGQADPADPADSAEGDGADGQSSDTEEK